MELGSVADWVIAAITAVGFGAAVIQLRANLNDSRAAREQARQDEAANREAMARAVGVKALWKPEEASSSEAGDGQMPIEVEVINSGPYPINTAVLKLASDDDGHPLEVVYGTILPGEHLKDTHMVHRSEVVFGEITGGATLEFTDTYGNHWARSTYDLEGRDQPARIC